ncbi:hypothetical protein BC938DRAFT_480129 [Jimgerdemannia flammicorona]|uniref:Uncharacterized protein n=1 Tax=Jimgerdemannia flammicorona TaxID=994334 RepID=A0A433QXN2_9FUNG|nr:hypothetical protein BC938DRAFT_480129 [Jimgerdemannia flammicorona]
MQEREAIFLLIGVSSMDSIDQQGACFLDAQEIAVVLDYMPLAIALARAYVEDAQCSFKDYLNMFKESKERIIRLRYKNEDNSDVYKHMVATVCQLSLEHIQTKNSTAVKILKACAFLQAENISVCFFKRQYSILKLLSNSATSSSSEENSGPRQAIERAIRVFIKFSLVTQTCENVKDNEVVQRATC